MDTALLLLPDFLLIACGFVICRYTALDRSVWDAAERLVYYLLFPVLLFNAIVRNPMPAGALASLGLAGVGLSALGIALAFALGHWPGVDRHAHASGAQTAFRFNSYVALALAERLGGAAGLAIVALLVSLCVPVVNVAAVWPLARAGKQGFLRELARNPLILSTVAGLVASAVGLRLPDAIALTLQRIGLAALPIGLMAVGAGLRLGALRKAPGLAAALLSIRHLALPAAAVLIVPWTGLPLLEQSVLVAFAALPTASSAYVLAARLGGQAEFVAGLVTVSTLIGMVSVPLALAAWSALVPLVH